MRTVEHAIARYGESERALVQTLSPEGFVGGTLTYREITRAAQALAVALREVRRKDSSTGARVGVVTANTPAFIVADLALLSARGTEVPVPLAFSAAQAGSLLEGIDLCLVDAAGRARITEWGIDAVLPPGCALLDIDIDAALASDAGPFEPLAITGDWICKIIHTSGTTSRPKGVRIRANGLDALLSSLADVMPHGSFSRYLSLIPFSLLIEQVTGIYSPILDGGTIVLLPEDVQLVGTSPSAPNNVLPYVRAAKPSALVATPVLVDTMAAAAQCAAAAGEPVASALFGQDLVPLVCCGGAPVLPDTLRLLDTLGIPVYEGYGLSENSSVVCWNTPGARRFGTVGRPLRHVQLRIAWDGELLVKSQSLFAGYTREDPSSCAFDADGWLHTGDLAAVDADGFVRITGRKKNVIITASGRNVAPEWVEAQYAGLAFVRAVAVVGDNLSALHGLFLIDPNKDRAQARAQIDSFGALHLSDVERVQVCHVAPVEQHLYDRFFTVTGRPVRHLITQAIANDALVAV